MSNPATKLDLSVIDASNAITPFNDASLGSGVPVTQPTLLQSLLRNLEQDHKVVLNSPPNGRGAPEEVRKRLFSTINMLGQSFLESPAALIALVQFVEEHNSPEQSSFARSAERAITMFPRSTIVAALPELTEMATGGSSPARLSSEQGSFALMVIGIKTIKGITPAAPNSVHSLENTEAGVVTTDSIPLEAASFYLGNRTEGLFDHISSKLTTFFNTSSEPEFLEGYRYRSGAVLSPYFRTLNALEEMHSSPIAVATLLGATVHNINSLKERAKKVVLSLPIESLLAAKEHIYKGLGGENIELSNFCLKLIKEKGLERVI